MPSKKNYVDRETVLIPSYPPNIETVSEYLDKEFCFFLLMKWGNRKKNKLGLSCAKLRLGSVSYQLASCLYDEKSNLS